jgi:hypothetical protein
MHRTKLAKPPALRVRGRRNDPGLHMDYPARPSPLIPAPAHTEAGHVTGVLDAGTHTLRA